MKCFWNQTVVRVLSVLTLGATLFAPATVHARGFGGGGGGHSFSGAARALAGNGGGGHFAQHLQNGARNLGQPNAAKSFMNNHANGGSPIGQAVRQNSSLQNKFQGNRTNGGLVKNLSQNNGMKTGVANNFSKNNTFASNFAKNNSFAKSNKGIVNNVAKNDAGKRGNGLHQNGPRNLQQGTLKNLAGGPNGLRDGKGGKGRDGKGRDHDGRGRDGKGRDHDGRGRDGKGRDHDGRGRDGKGRGRGGDNDMVFPGDGRWMGLGLGILDAVQGLGGGGGGGGDCGGGDCGGGDGGGFAAGDLDNFADNSMPMNGPMQMVDQPMDMNQEVAQAPPQEEGPPPVDLELAGVELLEPGDMAAAKGPLYRVAVMNKSDVPVPGFDVAVVATNGEEPGQKSPFAHKRVEYIAPGDVGVVDIRLPAKANQLVSEAEPFTTLFVGVDSRGEIQETDKDNNIAKVQRTDIPNAGERLASAQ